MKHIICFILFLFLFFNFVLHAQNENDPPVANYEVKVSNESNNNSITVRIYPVSMVFNGDLRYNLNAFNPLNVINWPDYNFINGRNDAEYFWNISPGNEININHDQDDNNEYTNATIGYGIYKLEVKCDAANFFDTCTINYDAGYPGNLSADIQFEYRDNTDITGSGPRVVFYWGGCTEIRNISQVNRKMYAWDQCSGRTRNWNPGNIIYNSSNGNSRTLLPQDYRNDCNTYENYPDATGQWGIGVLPLNLTIDKDNVRTRLYNSTEGFRHNAPDQIVISSNCTLKLNDSRQFVIKYDPFFDDGLPENFNKFYVKPDAVLKLNQNSFYEI